MGAGKDGEEPRERITKTHLDEGNRAYLEILQYQMLQREKANNCMNALSGIANRPAFKFLAHLAVMDCKPELSTK